MNRRWPWVVVALVVTALAVVGFWAFREPPSPAPPPAAAQAPPPDAGEQPQPPPVDVAAGDALAQGLVPQAWLQGGDVVRRAAAAVYAVAQGQSPRALVPFLEPGGTFMVEERREAPPKARGPGKAKPTSRFFISPQNDARYDAVTEAFTRIDAAAVGRAYATLRPYLEAAFREIAPPGKTFDAAFTQAVDRLAAVPISDGPREVVPMEQGIGYAWADPKLEALPAADKHLLRMGPKNARAVVKQLQAFRAAMAAP